MAVGLEQFVKSLEDSGIITPSKLKAVREKLPSEKQHDAQELARELVRLQKLTKFQAQEAYQGKAKNLVLGNYVILDKIGAGGMGQVYKAQHRRMDRIVAIKMLPSSMTKDAAAIARFEREVKAAAKLRHSNIVAADDADQARGIHFLVMEYVEGSDLSALVKKNGPFSVAKSVDFVVQAARGLEYAHKKRVVHRDIKPANLLLDNEGTVKILDMGLARLESGIGGDAATAAELTTSGQIMGTVDYMSPEQAFNTKQADGRADIYSLGCTLFYLLTGRPVFGGETIMEKLLAHREKQIPSIRELRDDVPEQVEAVYQKMLAKTPEDRYQSMSEVIADLQPLSTMVNSTTGSTNAASSNSNLTFLKEAAAGQTVQRKLTKQGKQPKADSGEAKQPPWKNVKVLVGAGAAGLAVLLGVILIVRDKDDKEVARIDATDGTKVTLPAGGSVQVQQSGSTAPNATTAASTSKLFIHDPAFPAWMKSVQAMPAEGQVKAVSKKLMELNPGFDGVVLGYNGISVGDGLPAVENGVVTGIAIRSEVVTDISPIKALKGLKSLLLAGSGNRKVLTDISPLKGMSLTKLSISYAAVSDLSPLEGMKLTRLGISISPVTDLTPLQGMPLTMLTCNTTPVADLSPLQGLPLSFLHCNGTGVADLSPLQECKSLLNLSVVKTKVTPATVAALQAKLPNCKIEWDDPIKPTTPATPLGPAPPLAVAPFDASQARAHQAGWANYLGTEVETPNSVGMKMILIPPGEFMMGSTDEQVEEALKVAEEIKADQAVKHRIQKNERPQHKVVITKPLLMSATEVTVGQFKRFVEESKYVTEAEQYGFGDSSATLADEKITVAQKQKNWRTPGYTVNDNSPVAEITWKDAVAYCQWLSTQEKATYRLPTEAEWEYACRAGTMTQYSFGNEVALLAQYGWYNKNASGTSHPTGTLLSNGFGLFDMHGNVQEWCGDYLDEKWYEKTSLNDPIGPVVGSSNVIRGGFWGYDASHCRSASRNHFTPSTRVNNLGFRVVRELPTSLMTASVTPQPTNSASSTTLFLHDPAFPQWMADVQAMPAQEQIEAVSKKLVELNPGFDGVLSGDDGKMPPDVGNGIENGVVKTVKLRSDNLTDISPLRVLNGLTYLACDAYPNGSKLSDLSPLQGMKLWNVGFIKTNVSDLSPLRGMPLRSLRCWETPVADLSPLYEAKLESLNIHRTKVPPAAVVALQKAFPNCKIEWDDPAKVTTPQPAASSKLFMHDPAFQQWMKVVQAMPAQEQINAVSKKLMELNPGFDGTIAGYDRKLPPKILNDVVLEIGIVSDHLTDISPIRAFAGVRLVDCSATSAGSRLTNLSPLSGLRLSKLRCDHTQVSDLSPLVGMPLDHLNLGWTRISDLSPICDFPLNNIYLVGSREIVNWSPLQKCTSLTSLNIVSTKVTPAEVATLQNALPKCNIFWDDPAKKPASTTSSTKLFMHGPAFPQWMKDVQAMPAEEQIEAVRRKLMELNPEFDGAMGADAGSSAVKGKPKVENGVVTQVALVSSQLLDLSPLRAFAGLKKLSCHVPQGPANGILRDLSPLTGMQLTGLSIRGQKFLSDLTPLKSMPLNDLDCSGCKSVSDLTPLQDMALTTLNLRETPIADLSPLRGINLKNLDLFDCRQLVDLSPLKEMKLESFAIGSFGAMKVSDLSVLAGMPLKDIQLNYNPERDKELLRSIKTLERINFKPSAEFLEKN